MSFDIGDMVVARFALDQPASDELPLQILARRGDVLFIRSLNHWEWDYNVSHPGILDRTFGVCLYEIRKLSDSERENILAFCSAEAKETR